MIIRFPGKFGEALIQKGKIVVIPRPYIEVTVSDGFRSDGVNFLIDTGCDQTTLHPKDAYELWGRDLLGWDFEGDQSRKTSAGVSGLAASMERDVRLSFTADDDRVESLYSPVELMWLSRMTEAILGSATGICRHCWGETCWRTFTSR